MAGTVKVPGIGKPLPKWAVFGGAGAVGYLVWKNRSSQPSATTAAAATAAGQYPPDGTTGNPSDPYSTDPATGQTYGAEATGAGGSYGAYGSGGGGGWDPNTGMYTDPNGAQCQNPDANGYCPSPTGSNGPPFSRNSQWSGWVIQTMTASNPGQDVGTLTDALGLYLAGQPADAAQKTLIFDAIAVGGDPPVAGPNGYPPKVMANGSKGPGGQVTVPDVLHKTRAEAQAKIRAAGLQVRTTPAGSKPGAHVTHQSPAGGKKAAKGSIVHIDVK